MVSIKEILFLELKKYVEVAYLEDLDLMKKYHVNENYNLEEAVTETLRMIEVTSESVDMKYFGVTLGEENIGYLCIFKNNLYSFGININYRIKEILIAFWENIITVLNDGFITMLYPNNLRAINWLQKCGMVIVEGVEENCVVLLNK